MANEPKLHHYLAEAYLRHFTDEGGNLHVLDRRTREIRRQRPEVTAAERELYTLYTDGQPDRAVERFLAEHVDGPGLGVISTLASGGRLADADRDPLARFVAALLLRTPWFRNQNRQMAERMREALVRSGVRPVQIPSNGGLRPLQEPHGVRTDVLLASIEKARSGERPYQNDFVSMMLGLWPLIAQTLLNMDWVVATAPAHKSFITSDAPVVMSTPNGVGPNVAVGLATPGVEKVIPLTRQLALIIWDTNDAPTIRYGTIDRDRLRQINETLARKSTRFSMGCSGALLKSILEGTGLGEATPPHTTLIFGDPEQTVE
jgi:hypothetical protein